ncbi:MAG: hypothetical protein KAQ90_12390, partial [Melioribacteraceae bacterium]|nr:hypothetical protein [Melioribacteraceae bacterium]
ILPFNIEAGKFRRAAVKLKIAKDPLTTLWQHNDNLEKRMMELRNRRRDKLEYYFALNKKLRKTLHSLLPIIKDNYKNQELILRAGSYKDLLKRFVLTPRIHQKLITTRDQFSINTTVHNIVEINEISGKYGNPGMVLGLQVSMSNNPEALISLDRKFNSKREEVLRENKYSILPRVWSIPLFEDTQTVTNIDNYLDRIWDYSKQSRTIDQNSQDRFTEIICEIFVAGSDLSQQVGQTASAELYKESKQRTIEWLAKKGLVEKVRMKLGSGEPMQRQGGYYADFSGKPAFIRSTENMKRFKNHLKESTVKSIEFAVSPLHGLFSGGDLRTLQSNISEKMRHLSVDKRAQMLYHLYNLQKYYQRELERASEPFLETRLQFESRGLKVLERLTIGKDDELFKKFIELSRQNFRDILYGKPEDVVGIHIISYFISRTTPTFRDRPTVRPSRNIGENQGHKILERIAGTIPLSKHGSLLRAIGHNRGQTMILGINQLTSGLFRALNEFSKMEFSQGDGSHLLSDRILPNLPVYEILESLRLYQDREYKYLDKLLDAYPAGNSAFSLLREDNDSMDLFIPLLQKELLRRHGLNVNEFFEDENFIPDLLPTLRPDLAVLLQPDIFNTNIESIIKLISGDIDADWLNEIERLLSIPERVKYWREKIWMLLEKPVKEQVKSFVELAIALNTLSHDIGTPKLSLASSSIKNVKFSTSLSGLLKGRGDDSMRQFLSAAVQYLTRLPEDMVEVPIDIIRALKEVERILKIEKQALDKKEQDLLKFYTLQIARLTGENG